MRGDTIVGLGASFWQNGRIAPDAYVNRRAILVRDRTITNNELTRAERSLDCTWFQEDL